MPSFHHGQASRSRRHRSRLCGSSSSSTQQHTAAAAAAAAAAVRTTTSTSSQDQQRIQNGSAAAMEELAGRTEHLADVVFGRFLFRPTALLTTGDLPCLRGSLVLSATSLVPVRRVVLSDVRFCRLRATAVRWLRAQCHGSVAEHILIVFVHHRRGWRAEDGGQKWTEARPSSRGPSVRQLPGCACTRDIWTHHAHGQHTRGHQNARIVNKVYSEI